MKWLLVLVAVALISGCVSETPTSLEQYCIESGGTVTTGLCCLQTGDFPNTCLIGACGCAPSNSHEVKICDCGGGCFNGTVCILPD